MCGSMVDIQSTAVEIRRGKKKEERRKKEEDRNHRAKIQWSALLHRATIIMYAASTVYMLSQKMSHV